ncbi:hypothetical protein O7A70_33060 [Mesorhizobium sp. Cs1299R1N1]|uniref:hypothetical protein n=1 Tax=Mesorhizobium sp. Cs1299R1N1 TaxID=3015172 RepID=UPI00301CEC91
MARHGSAHDLTSECDGKIREIVEATTNKARKNPASDTRFFLFDTEIDAVAVALHDPFSINI